jgi:hypothetical protein
MDDMVTRVVEVLDEVGVCNTTDEEYYKTIKLNELSPDLLGRYKTKAAVQAKALDKKGKYKKANKRFTGITRATNKQFSNDRDEYEKEKERQRKQDAYARNIAYDTARHKSKTKYRNVDVGKRPTQTKPSKTNKEVSNREKDKEAERKDRKSVSPNVPLRWNGQRWIPRKKDSEYYQDKRRNEDLDSQANQLNWKPDKDMNQETQLLIEVSGRTVALGIALANIHRHHKTRDTGGKKLKSLGSSLQTAKTDNEKWKILGQIFSVIGDTVIPQAKSDWWQGAATASGTFGLDKKIRKLFDLIKDLQKHLKQKKRR